jgi:hypothetical protein
MRGRMSLAVLFLFSASARAEEPRSTPNRADSRFSRDGVEYRIRVEKFAGTTAYSPAIRIAYRVWRDGRFLHPEDPNAGRHVAPVFQSEQSTPPDVAPFPDAVAPVGWSIRCGWGSGATTDDLAIVVLPQKETYCEVAWHWKDLDSWTVVRTDETSEIWTLARDEGNAGTWANVFVPERRVLSKNGTSLELKALDPDWRTWPEPYSTAFCFPVAFVAGLRQENSALMRAALGLWAPDHQRWCEEFGLPHELRELTELTDAVEALTNARQRIRAVSRIGPRSSR